MGRQFQISLGGMSGPPLFTMACLLVCRTEAYQRRLGGGELLLASMRVDGPGYIREIESKLPGTGLAAGRGTP